MFITDFELYLRTACKCGYNTTAKFMQFFKRIIIIARNNGILVGDPFASYKIRLEKVDRGYLTEDEIKIILKKKMVSERLEHVRYPRGMERRQRRLAVRPAGHDRGITAPVARGGVM